MLKRIDLVARFGKTIFYVLSLKEVLKDIDKITNIMFILAEISEVAKFSATSAVGNISMFGEVYGIFLNVNDVIENYCYGKDKNFRDEFEKVIDSKASKEK